MAWMMIMLIEAMVIIVIDRVAAIAIMAAASIRRGPAITTAGRMCWGLKVVIRGWARARGRLMRKIVSFIKIASFFSIHGLLGFLNLKNEQLD